MGVMPALDLVIAMPISWLPLVADYARHGKSGGAALRGTWLGYALANMWCYALGVLVALTLPSQDLVQALLLAQGGLIALSLILIDEVDNAYGDTYSGAVSAHSLLPRWSMRRWGLAWPRVHAAGAGAAHAQPGAIFAAAQLGVRAAVRRDPGAPGLWHQCPPLLAQARAR
jgi:purine-cytosine permease-like protein